MAFFYKYILSDLKKEWTYNFIKSLNLMLLFKQIQIRSDTKSLLTELISFYYLNLYFLMDHLRHFSNESKVTSFKQK